MRIMGRPALWRLMLNPTLHFGDLYAAGEIKVDGDLVRFLEHVYVAVVNGRRGRGSSLWRLWRDRKPGPTHARAARANIQQHYDLGNDFYALWLDREGMQYTCAYFDEGVATLEGAQRAKMDHVCRKLQLRPGQRVVEAGCGWGGFAVHMAANYGVEVDAYNISREQIRYATGWAARLGLSGRVRFIEDDCRNIRGSYDAFVSIGMLEHVGVAHYRELGAVIERALAPHGVGLIHTIGRNQPERLNGWIEQRIFPGAQPPSLGEMMRLFEPNDFSVLDVENLRLHYAETLRHWMQRFDQHAGEVRSRYGEVFERAWRLYLAGSIAAFEVGTMQLFQVLFAHERSNAIARTRRHLYEQH
jgi:cyclopropane-fatty-acyl-phospholipid synthase